MKEFEKRALRQRAEAARKRSEIASLRAQIGSILGERGYSVALALITPLEERVHRLFWDLGGEAVAVLRFEVRECGERLTAYSWVVEAENGHTGSGATRARAIEAFRASFREEHGVGYPGRILSEDGHEAGCLAGVCVYGCEAEEKFFAVAEKGA